MHSRRTFLDRSATLAALAAAGVLPRPALAAVDGGSFEARSIAEALRTLGASQPVESREVAITAPDVAENGAAVLIGVSTTLTNARRLVLMVEKNPNVVSAVFELNEHVEPGFSTRVKMAQSSNVWAVAVTGDGKALYARKDVRVTLGGCGA